MRLWILLGTMVFGWSAQAAELDYEGLVALIQGQRLTTIEDVLPKLPEELRASYSLMYRSRSLQGATPSAPRVILYGSDASLICTFNGDEAETGHDTLECIQFRAAEDAFDFRQIRFPTARNGLSAVAFSARGRTTDGKVSCSACHGPQSNDPRPNWDRYDEWPGAYGAIDDRVVDPGAHETELAAFVAARARHPRYKWLVQPPGRLSPFLNDFTVGARPNLRLSSLVNRMNARRAERLLAAGVKPWSRLAFAAENLGCALTEEQKSRLRAAGIGTDTAALALAAFQQLGLKPAEWATDIFDDVPPPYPKPYEHFGGYGQLSRDVGLAILAKEAARGNEIFRRELAAIAADEPAGYPAPELAFFAALNGILPDPYVGKNQVSREACAEMARIFVGTATGG